MQPGEDGNDRKVWMFPIRPVPDNDVKKPQMFVFKDMDDYENRGKNVDAEYTKMMAAAKKKEQRSLYLLHRLFRNQSQNRRWKYQSILSEDR